MDWAGKPILTLPHIEVAIDGKRWMNGRDDSYVRLPRNGTVSQLQHRLTKWGAPATSKRFPPGCWMYGNLLQMGMTPGDHKPHGQAIEADTVELWIDGRYKFFEIATGYVLGCLLVEVEVVECVYLVLYLAGDEWQVREVEAHPTHLIQHRRSRDKR